MTATGSRGMRGNSRWLLFPNPMLTATIVEANRRSANTAAAVGRFKHAPVIARTASAGRAPQLVGVEGAERGRIAAPRFANV